MAQLAFCSVFLLGCSFACDWIGWCPACWFCVLRQPSVVLTQAAPGSVWLFAAHLVLQVMQTQVLYAPSVQV